MSGSTGRRAEAVADEGTYVRSKMFSILLVAAVTLLPALPAAAQAEAAGTADATGAEVDVFGQLQLGLGSSEAAASDEPQVDARGVGFSEADGTISEISITSGTERDPAEGQNCLTPDLGVAGLTLGVTCSHAQGDASAPSALGSAVVGDIGVDGSAVTALVDELVALVLEPVAAEVDAATAELGGATGEVVAPVIDQVNEQCVAGLTAITNPLIDAALAPLVDELQNASPEETAPIIDEIDELLTTAGESLPEACVVLLDLVTTPPAIGDVTATVQAALTAALADQQLLTVAVGDTVSQLDTANGGLVAAADALGAGITTPSLDFLAVIVDAVVQELIEGLLEDLAGETSSLSDIDIATLDELLGPALASLSLPDLLTAEDPILTIEVLDSSASATLSADGDVATEATAATIRVIISSAFAELLGEENTTISVEPGQSQTLFEGTPLESTLSAGAIEEFTVAAADSASGIELEGIRAIGLEAQLFTGAEGGLGLTLSTVEAAVGGEAPAPVAAQPTLPTTGGGLAMLGLLAIAGAATLRRD